MLFNLEEISSFDIMMIIITMENNMGGGGKGHFFRAILNRIFFFNFAFEFFFFFCDVSFQRYKKVLLSKVLKNCKISIRVRYFLSYIEISALSKI